MVGGATIIDTVEGWLVWEHPNYPAYYLPRAAFAETALNPTGASTVHPNLGESELCDLMGHEGSARLFKSGPGDSMTDAVRVEWGAVDMWFEEDKQVFVHPKDPYKRVEILASSRSVRIELEGRVLAETNRGTLVLETGLIARWYVPRPDVRFNRLVASTSRTHCPYKGEAMYWSLNIGDQTETERVQTDPAQTDIAWSYQAPTHESAELAGLLCFYAERVNTFVDGRELDRPETPFV
jgi:uncharacterized protein (DUF427 family)